MVGELKQVDQKYTSKIAKMQEQHEMVSFRSREDVCVCEVSLAFCFASCVIIFRLFSVLFVFNCLLCFLLYLGCTSLSSSVSPLLLAFRCGKFWVPCVR